MTSFRVCVFTLFPGMFPGPLGYSLAGKALEARIWSLETVNIRCFARDKRRTVDCAPFGGGPGMVMRADVIDAALQANHEPRMPLIYLTPRGRVLTQANVRTLASAGGLGILCGRFEGVDQRVLDKHGADELSIGDYILSGGEIAALVLVDSIVRLLPGVVQHMESLEEESFSQGLLEYPQYTRPRVWAGQAVPSVLVSGHHKRVAEWRHAQAEMVTRERRPDLWHRFAVTMSNGREGRASR
ncbi:tRNA (Guanine37-N1) -methyltransferase [invertebrate metagenome]|uniref:tRNA (guanine-N(1)-)-methyltransferase n=1 Tax=invertebrate metagenome TaxID=1711999 RepID=A0A484H8F6_9ZZZZ